MSQTELTLRHWLMKSEPDVYSLDQLAQDQRTSWEGVRNYQARNFMRDQMQVGDWVLFYHSSCPTPGIAGLARVSKNQLADPSQFDAQSPYFDPKSQLEHPRWIMVELEYESHFPCFVSLADLRQEPALSGLGVLQRGTRLSVQAVSATHFELICRLGQRTQEAP